VLSSFYLFAPTHYSIISNNKHTKRVADAHVRLTLTRPASCFSCLAQPAILRIPMFSSSCCSFVGFWRWISEGLWHDYRVADNRRGIEHGSLNANTNMKFEGTSQGVRKYKHINKQRNRPRYVIWEAATCWGSKVVRFVILVVFEMVYYCSNVLYLSLQINICSPVSCSRWCALLWVLNCDCVIHQ